MCTSSTLLTLRSCYATISIKHQPVAACLSSFWDHFEPARRASSEISGNDDHESREARVLRWDFGWMFKKKKERKLRARGRDGYSGQIAQKNEGRSRSHARRALWNFSFYSARQVLSRVSDPAEWKSRVRVRQGEGSLSGHASITRASAYAKLEPRFLRILQHWPQRSAHAHVSSRERERTMIPAYRLPRRIIARIIARCCVAIGRWTRLPVD